MCSQKFNCNENEWFVWILDKEREFVLDNLPWYFWSGSKKIVQCRLPFQPLQWLFKALSPMLPMPKFFLHTVQLAFCFEPSVDGVNQLWYSFYINQASLNTQSSFPKWKCCGTWVRVLVYIWQGRNTKAKGQDNKQ